MSDDRLIELSGQLRTAQDKYTYFLLAAAGAGVALAVDQTSDSMILYSMIPLGFAVLSWGFSFYCGCRQLLYVMSALYANFDLLLVQSGQHPDAGTHPDYIAAASEGIRNAIETKMNKIEILARSSSDSSSQEHSSTSFGASSRWFCGLLQVETASQEQVLSNQSNRPYSSPRSRRSA